MSATPSSTSSTRNGSIPIVFGALTPAGLTQVSGETADRLAADDVQCHEPVHGRDDRSVHRGTRRWQSAPAAMRERVMRMSKHWYAAQAQAAVTRYAAIYTKAPPVAPIRAALEHVGRGLRRIADHRWQHGARLQQHDVAAFTAPPSAPITASRRIRIAGFSLAGGGTNFSVANGLAPADPICSRPARSSGTMSARPISRRAAPMAGRTSPPIAP